MQKLIILDSETGIAHIIECPLDFDGSGSEESDLTYSATCEQLGISENGASYMLALEINDTTK